MATNRKDGKVFVLDTLRLPTGRVNGLYKDVIPEKMVAFLLQQLAKRNPLLPDLVNQVIVSTTQGTDGNLARYAVLEAGFPENVPAFTIDAQCIGGLKGIELGTALIRSGMCDLVVVAGVEQNSLAPIRQYHPNDPRATGENFRYAQFAPPVYGKNGLTDTAEAIISEFGFSKKQLMKWTVKSNERAAFAMQNGLLKDLLVGMDGQTSPTDETIKSAELIERIYAYYPDKLLDPSTTCSPADGAAAVILGSETMRNALAPEEGIEVLQTANVGVHPKNTPISFINSVAAVLKKQGLKLTEVDLFEINESFALKPVVFKKHFSVKNERINVLGGNLAYGHPYGASGLQNFMHLHLAMSLLNKRFGITAAAAAGGIGEAILLRNNAAPKTKVVTDQS